MRAAKIFMDSNGDGSSLMVHNQENNYRSVRFLVNSTQKNPYPTTS